MPINAVGVHEADVNLIMWVLSWDWHALTTDPLSLYQANIFHPARDTLAGSEHLLGHVPIFGPAYALSGNPVFASQFNIWMCFALSGAAMYALMRHWGVGAAAALFAGLVYTFATVRLWYLAHFHLLAGYCFPLALVAIDRCLRDVRPVWALLFGILFLLQILSSYYIAYISAFALLGYGGGVLWARRGRVPLRAVIYLGAAVAVVLAVFAAISIPYIRLAESGVIPEYTHGSIAAAGTGRWRAYLIRDVWDESDGRFSAPRFYLGWTIILLAIGALGWRRSAIARIPWAAGGAVGIAVVCYLMGQGPGLAGDAFGLPYAWATQFVPGFSSMRVPQRFGLYVSFGVSCLAGLGFELIQRRLRLQWLGVIVIVAVVVWDFGWMFRRFGTLEQSVGEGLPPVYRHLETLPRGPLLELPMRGPHAFLFAGSVYETRKMLSSTYHWFPLLNGHSGYTPPSYWVAVAVAQALPDRDALELLTRMTGLRYVLVHTDEFRRADLERWIEPEGLRSVVRAPGGWLFEVENPPAVDLVERFLDTSIPTHTILGTPIEVVPPDERRSKVEILDGFGSTTHTRHIRVVKALVTNTSSRPWPSVSPVETNLVMAKCGWSNPNGKPLRFRATNTHRLPTDLQPGKSIEVAFQCSVPPIEGNFRFHVAVVQGDEWFDGASEPVPVKVGRPPWLK